jgi:hypothetical protein
VATAGGSIGGRAFAGAGVKFSCRWLGAMTRPAYTPFGSNNSSLPSSSYLEFSI